MKSTLLAAVLAAFSCPPVMAHVVKDSLNVADLSFASGDRETACLMVSNALMAANNNVDGPSPVSRSELARYASRCNLRF